MTEKEKIIESIKTRIISEKRKYENIDEIDWVEIAAIKIYNSINEQNKKTH